MALLRLVTLAAFCCFSFSPASPPAAAAAAAPLRRASAEPPEPPPAAAPPPPPPPPAAAAAAEAPAAAGAAAAAPLDLSPQGIDALMRDLTSALSSPSVLGLEESFNRVLSLLSDLLKSAEGLLLPPHYGETASQLAQSLRGVFAQQSLLKGQLAGLQSVAAGGGLAAAERQSLRDIGERLLLQYKELEANGMQLLQQLTELLLSLFPDLQPPIHPSVTEKEVKMQQEELIKAAKELFPDILQ